MNDQYVHKIYRTLLTENINKLLKDADEEKRKFILKIIRAVVR